MEFLLPSLSQVRKKESENRISPVDHSFLKENTYTHTQKNPKKSNSIVKEVLFVRNTSLWPLLGGRASTTGVFRKYFGSKTIFCEK